MVVVVVVAVSVVDGRYFAAAKIRVFCGAFRAGLTTEDTESTEEEKGGGDFFRSGGEGGCNGCKIFFKFSVE